MNTQNQTIAGVARAAMLVDLHISTYSGRKQDRKTQDEVTTSKGAGSKRAASVYKSLFAECKELDDVIKFQARVRATHYRLTLPWSDTGTRLLPTKALFEYQQVMSEHKTEFDNLVDRFLDRYDTLVAAAAFQLGTLFDRNEYPTRDHVANKFSMTSSFSPLPISGDFRLDIESEVQQDLIDQYEKRAASLLESAQRDAWGRLHEALSRMSERLANDEKGERKIFHGTLVTNAEELCSLLVTLNVTNDPQLEAARLKLRDALVGVSPDELRKSDGARAETKRRVDEILDAFDWEA